MYKIIIPAYALQMDYEPKTIEYTFKTKESAIIAIYFFETQKIIPDNDLFVDEIDEAFDDTDTVTFIPAYISVRTDAVDMFEKIIRLSSDIVTPSTIGDELIDETRLSCNLDKFIQTEFEFGDPSEII